MESQRLKVPQTGLILNAQLAPKSSTLLNVEPEKALPSLELPKSLVKRTNFVTSSGPLPLFLMLLHGQPTCPRAIHIIVPPAATSELQLQLRDTWSSLIDYKFNLLVNEHDGFKHDIGFEL